jgi:indole-3-glycerol phosphate synthase
MILERIAASKREEVAAEKDCLPLAELQPMLRDLPPCRDFTAALRSPDGSVRLIAEIKGASPSKGVIRESFDPSRIARAYQCGEAAAISVLTDREFFHGRPEYLGQVRQVCSLPLLRKDFIIDTYQIYQSRLMGADAVLLIAALLADRDLVDYLALAAGLGLAALVEVHTAAELERVLRLPAELIGINNRDLHSFRVDLETTAALRPLIPAGPVVVSESGIRGRRDVERLADAGVDAVLVGEALMAAADQEAMVRQMLGAKR